MQTWLRDERDTSDLDLRLSHRGDTQQPRGWFRLLQFHGDESATDIAGYSVPVFKAFRVDKDFDVKTLGHFPIKTFLLDTFINGIQGGTGKAFDWSIAIAAKQYGRIILSGGLKPENVAEAVHIVRPYAVDVNSGVESSPGKKDKSKLNDLFLALRTT